MTLHRIIALKTVLLTCLVAASDSAAAIDSPHRNELQGGVTEYEDFASFEQAAGPIASENFQGGPTGPGQTVECAGGFNSETDNACFAPGDLVEGFSVLADSGPMAVRGADENLPALAVGPPSRLLTTHIDLDPPVAAVAVNAYRERTGAGSIDITLRGTDGNVLAAASVPVTGPLDPAFRGFASAAPIASVTLSGSSNRHQWLSELHFSLTPRLTISPTSLDLGAVDVGTASAPGSATLSSTGLAPVEISAIDPPAAPFAVTGGDCPAAPFALAPGQACTIEIQCHPASVEVFQAALPVHRPDAPSADVALRCEGVDGLPGLDIVPAVLDFGAVQIGAGPEPEPRSVVLSSTGQGPVTIHAIADVEAPFARVGGDCPATPFALDPSQSCTLDYEFTPEAILQVEQRVAVDSNINEGPTELVLFGEGFDPPEEYFDPSPNSSDLVLGGVMADGRIVVGGRFTQIAGYHRPKLARLSIDGTLDAEFRPRGPEAIPSGLLVDALALLPDGKVLVGGNRSAPAAGQIVRLDLDGSVDESFASDLPTATQSTKIFLQSDGKILVNNSASTGCVHRLNADGTIDSGFSMDFSSITSTSCSTGSLAFAQQPDGKILVGGSFKSTHQVDGGGNPVLGPRRYLTRLHPDGSVDESFVDLDATNTTIPVSGLPAIKEIVLFPDGKILIVGQFSTIKGESRLHVARLHSDGSVDTSFGVAGGGALDGGTSTRPPIFAAALLPDGKVLIGGAFTTISNGGAGGFRPRLARLNPDGSLDLTFDAGIAQEGSILVSDVAVQADEKIVIAGVFTHVNAFGDGEGVPRLGMARLNPDGSLDLGPGELSISPDPVDFDTVSVGHQSLRSITLTNLGPSAVDLQSLDGPLPSPPFFAEDLGDSDCGSMGLTLAPEASCTIELRCAPEAIGEFTGSLQILSNAANSPNEIALQCEGTEALVPELSIAPSTVNFGSVEVGSTTDAQVATLSSVGTAPVDVTGIGGASAPFALVGGDCPAVPFSLAPTETCTLAYDFAPIQAGAAQQTIPITSNAASASVQLIGQGVLVPVLSVTPSALDFGEVEVGASAETQAVTLASTGTGPVVVSAIVEATAPFARTGGTCAGSSFTLEPTESCTLIYGFAPASVGTFDQTIAITSDADPASIALSGTGIPAPLPPQISIDPEQLDFALVAGHSDSETLLIGNAGELDLDWVLRAEGGLQGMLHAGRASAPVDTAALPADADLANLVRGAGAPRTVTLTLAQPVGTDSTTLTHSLVPDQVMAENTVACGVQGQPFTVANQFLRTFSLPDFGLVGAFEVLEVSFGIESLTAAQDITVNLYTLDGTFVYSNLDLLASETVNLQPQQTSLVTVPISAEVPAGATLVMEIAAPSMDGIGAFFAGSNNLGQTAPSYIATSACGISQPATFASINFPNVHLLMSVTGHAETCGLPAWAGMDPLSGSVAGGGIGEADVGVDATGLSVGRHSALLCIDSNDPDRPLVTLPLKVDVAEFQEHVFGDGFEAETP